MKKVIRITESDLRKIINRIVEQDVDVISRAAFQGVFTDPTPTTGTTSTPAGSGTGGNNTFSPSGVSTEADVIKRANELKINNGEWTRSQSTSTKTQLWYKKTPQDGQSIRLLMVKTPNNIKQTNGKWSITNNKLNITD